MPRVLLVEDDPNECLLYAEELRGDGYDVVVAKDGHQALSLANSQSPDVVVMDVSMPGMDGIDAMGRMLARNNKLPIILNTAYASYKDDFRAWSADAYVVKSSDLKELKETIRRVLQARAPAK
jgi:CheY-like chemotaxis protein